MRRNLISAAAIAAFAFGMTLVSPAFAADDGKKLFLDYKCDSCHTIKSLGIKLGAKPDEKSKDAPDLSKAGAERDKKWIAGYLLKKNDIKGEKHEKRFSGTKDELKVLATWLGTLKK